MNDLKPRLGVRHPPRQSGVSLIAVLALLLLSLMAVMGAIRVASLNESLLGSSTDYNRTYAAAEAMMNDAEMDIRGRRPPFTTIQADGNYGFPCRSNAATGTATTACFLGCRQINGPPLPAACDVSVASVNPFIPEGGPDFDEVDRRIAASPGLNATRRCMQGICIPLNTTDLANIESDANLALMTPLGATYGQFTRANTYDVAPGVSGNPILTAIPARAWYWIEVFRYQTTTSGVIGSGMANINAPDPNQPYVFRITAIAQGLKLDTNGNPTTRVVLKSIFVPSIDPP